MEEKIEHAEIISEERDNVNKYFVAVNKVAVLSLAESYDSLLKERQQARLKYQSISREEANIKEIRDAKNSLVKLRTRITGGKDSIDKADKAIIKQAFKEVTDEYDYRVNTLIAETQPLEQELSKVVTEYDDKVKLEAEKKAREAAAKQAKILECIESFKSELRSKINAMKSSADQVVIELPDYDFEELFGEAITAKNQLVAEYNQNIEKLKISEAQAKIKEESERIEREKKELAEKQAEVKAALEELDELIADPEPEKVVQAIEELTENKNPEIEQPKHEPHTLQVGPSGVFLDGVKVHESKEADIPEIIAFAIFLTGHDRETIEQMYADWKRSR